LIGRSVRFSCARPGILATVAACASRYPWSLRSPPGRVILHTTVGFVNTLPTSGTHVGPNRCNIPEEMPEVGTRAGCDHWRQVQVDCQLFGWNSTLSLSGNLGDVRLFHGFGECTQSSPHLCFSKFLHDRRHGLTSFLLKISKTNSSIRRTKVLERKYYRTNGLKVLERYVSRYVCYVCL